MMGKSCEIALHSLVGHMDYNLVAFLAIEEAFDTVRPELIIQATDQLDICRSNRDPI